MYGYVFSFLAGVLFALIVDHLVDRYLGEVKFIIGEEE